MERWIAETIESLISQEGDFEIEYILADGGSSDRTVTIFEEYRKKIESGSITLKCKNIVMKSFSEKDKGTFDAINKGFSHATGDVYTWLDADNIYVPGALEGLRKIFSVFPEIQWIKGYSSSMNEEGVLINTRQTYTYRQDWLRDGIYGLESYHVNADTVLWRADLWKKSGPLPTDYRCAGEQKLWITMAKYAPLWTANLHVSVYRKRSGSLSKDILRCRKEKERARENKRTLQAWLARFFFSPQSRIYPKGERFFLWLYPHLFMSKKNIIEYIDFERGTPVKKVSKTFIIGENPSYENNPSIS